MPSAAPYMSDHVSRSQRVLSVGITEPPALPIDLMAIILRALESMALNQAELFGRKWIWTYLS